MTETPFLLAIIAHGKPVFEIGYRMECPMCEASSEHLLQEDLCIECDGEGHWWITNSGWRARPYWSIDMNDLKVDLSWPGELEILSAFHDLPPAPEDWPDLFQSYIDRTPRSAEPSALLASLGLTKPKAPIQRRALK